MHKGFEAVFDKNSRVLILGSFPSVKSRANGFYYGNKQNRFWRTLEKCFGEKIDDNIACKKAFLIKHHIALYDVVAESNLTGSADLSLKKSTLKMADFNFLLPPNTIVEKILCNGKTSYNLLTQNFTSPVPVVCLPSTSAANPRYNFDEWQNELKFLK